MKKWFYSLWGASGLIISLLYAAPVPAAITVSVQPHPSNIAPGGSFSVDIQVSGLCNPGPCKSDSRQIVRAYNLLLGYNSQFVTPTGIVTFGDKLGDNLNNESFQSFSNVNLPDQNLPYNGPNPPDKAVQFLEVSNLCGYGSEAPGYCSSHSVPPDPSDYDFSGGPYLSAIQPDTFTLVTVGFTATPAFLPNMKTTLALIDDRLMSWTDCPTEGCHVFDIKGNSDTTPLTVTLQNGQVSVPEPGTLSLLLGAGLVGIGRSTIRHRRMTAQLS